MKATEPDPLPILVLMSVKRSAGEDLRLLRFELRVGEDPRVLQLTELLELGELVVGRRCAGGGGACSCGASS